jgi:hypothetical protein
VPTPVVPRLVRVRAVITYGAELVNNVWHVKISAPPATLADEKEDLRTQFRGFYISVASALWPAGAHLQKLEYKDLSTANGAQYEDTITGADGAGAALPAQCSMVLSMFTAVGGRSHRGRVYLGPLKTTCIDGSGLFTSSPITTVGNAFNLLQQNLKSFTQSDAGLHVLSSKLGTADQVTSGRIGTVPDTQRRRRNKLAETYTIFTP